MVNIAVAIRLKQNKPKAIALRKKIQLENGIEVATKLITDYLKQQ